MDLQCTKTGCFICTMDEPNPSMRRSRLSNYFNELHLKDDQDLVMILRRIFKIAVAEPDNGEFPSIGVFECMSKLIDRAIRDKNWISRGKNLSIPYYAAHIIGTYTMNRADFAENAIKSGVISPLMELLGGKMSWVEQRVAVRALGHLASHKTTFQDIATYEEEIVNLTMEIASTCLNTIYVQFVEGEKRLDYQFDLLKKGRKGFVDMEEKKKAEEWATQLQSWSLYLLNCFAIKKRCINLICKKEFLKDLCGMWGGLENQNSFSGIELIKTICLTQDGRRSIANSKEVVKNLCDISRSLDECQCKAIESLILLLKDQETRYQVMEISAPFLVDLIELKSCKGSRKNRRVIIGDKLTQVLLRDYGKIKYGQIVLNSKKSEKFLKEVWDLKVERLKMDHLMSDQEFRERKVLVGMLKSEGNQKFWGGNTKEAIKKYTKALDLCPLKMKKERVVLYSNRAQCHLVLREAESAISDTTKALCLSGVAAPHIKSLWRRSQAYDMIGQARLSLMDCLVFVNQRSKLGRKKVKEIPYYAVKMLNKQINSTYVFTVAVSASRRRSNILDGSHEDGSDSTRRNTDERNHGMYGVKINLVSSV